ncbi:hypothetical protein [Paenibacillus sp. FSL R10-2734]|uniref:hypothetical protein n=1 Tax=Paenibacillus sp. FSL R10-2734 TaxID=2954691 RepID=UPI0030DD117C
MVVIVILVYVVIVLLDPYGLLKQGMKRDFWVCSFLCLVSFVIAVALSMKWSIPSPSPLIENLIKKLF